jgi:hypothetical protein
MATDVRYQAFTGTNQEYLEMIVCVASHEVNAISEIWLDNEKAWNGSVLGRYVGYLTVTTRTLGTSANGIAIDGTWTSSCTLTGCAYVYMKFKLTGNSDKVSSPFSGGVTSRMTIRGKGAKVYDPRLDSTVAGGSGTQRANDQTTWAWDDNGSRNPALQELWYELGWKINSKLAVGKGVPPARIDLASYAVGANACDESVTLNGGGTESRYRSDGVLSEADDPGAVRDNLCATMNAVLRDAGGKLALTVLHDDLSTPVTPSGKSAFDDNDVMGEMQWDQTPDLNQSFNIVRGRRIDPSDNALYQAVDVPEVSLTSIDGIDRIDTVDYVMVQSNGQAQRLMKQRLQRNQYQGRLSFTGKPSFWGLNIGDVFPLTHAAFGWSAKLFRCAGQKISRTGETQIVAIEENSAIYAWSNNETAAVTPGAPVVYNPVNDPLVSGITDINGISVLGDANRVRFSQMEQGALGYNLLYNSASLPFTLGKTVASGYNIVQIGVTFTAASQVVIIGTDFSKAAFRIPVTAGERIFVGLRTQCDPPGGVSTGSWQYFIRFMDSSGTYISGSGAQIGAGTGDSFGTRIGIFTTVPAGAFSAYIEGDLSSDSSTGAASIGIIEPMVVGATATQTAWPAFSPGPSSEFGADVTANLVGPAASDVNYDNPGTTFQSALDLNYKVQTFAGTVTSGVTMTYKVKSGTFNGFSSASGAQTMTVTSGASTITPTSLATDSATIEVTAIYNGRTLPAFTTVLNKVLAPATPTGTGGGGGGSTDVPSQTSGFTAINTATFTTITSSLTFTMPTGKTTLRCVVNLSCKYGKTANQTGPWDVEFKVQRGGVDQGTTQHSNPDPEIVNDPDFGDVANPGTMQYTLDMTGLTVGVQYTVVLQARVATGTLPTNGVNMTFSGSVALSAP